MTNSTLTLKCGFKRLKRIFIWILLHFQHCTGHITTGSWKGRGNQYIQFVRVLYCKLPTNSKQLPAFPLEAVPGFEPRPQRWEARVLPHCHRGPLKKDNTGSLHKPICTIETPIKSRRSTSILILIC